MALSGQRPYSVDSPSRFYVNSVVTGWSEMLQRMKLESVGRFIFLGNMVMVQVAMAVFLAILRWYLMCNCIALRIVVQMRYLY